MTSCLFLSAEFSGCLDSISEPRTEQSVASAAGPANLLLDACPNGVATFNNVPRDFITTPPPAGWGPYSFGTTEIRYTAYQCERIHIGPFERGPAFMLLETDSGWEPPATCDNDHPDFNRIIVRLWLDDEEIAAYLKAQFGLPAEVAEFTYAQTPIGPAYENRWTFGLPGMEASELVGQSSTNSVTEEPSFRYFWKNQVGGVSQMDFNEVWHHGGDGEDPLVITGTIREPLLFAKVGAWAGYGLNLFDINMSTEIVQFKDTLCEEPL